MIINILHNFFHNKSRQVLLHQVPRPFYGEGLGWGLLHGRGYQILHSLILTYTVYPIHFSVLFRWFSILFQQNRFVFAGHYFLKNA